MKGSIYIYTHILYLKRMCDFDVAYGNEFFFFVFVLLPFPRQFRCLIYREKTKQTIILAEMQCDGDNIVSRKWKISSSTNWFAIIADFLVSSSPSSCLSLSISFFSFYFSLFFFTNFCSFLPWKLNRGTD